MQATTCSRIAGTNDMWRPDCVCSTDDSTKPVSRPRSKIKPAFQHGETAIYYEPAEHVPSEGVSFVYHPFIILNPTFRRHSVSNTVNPAIKITSHIEDNIKEETKPSTKYKRKHNFTQKLQTEPEERPLYLDIAIQDTVRSRSSVKEFSSIDDLQVIEQNLLDCIDLHVLIYSRKNNNITKLKEIWGDNKFKKYDNLSNSDLMIKIQSKCGQPASVIKQSLNEIKKALPRKNATEHKPGQNDKFDEIITELPKATDIKGSYFTRSDELSSSTVKTTSAEKTQFEEKTTTSKYFSKSLNNLSKNNIKLISTRSTALNASNEQNEINQQTLTSTIEPTIQYYTEDSVTTSYNNRHITQSFSKKDSLLSVSPTSSEAIPENEYLPKNILKDSNISNTSTEHFFSDLPNNHSDKDINTIGFSYTDSHENISPAETSTENAVIDHSNITKNYQDLQSEGRVHKEHILLNSTTTVGDNRILYPEGEMKIPKVIVKEYPNDTVISEISGNELLPNNDFTYSTIQPILNILKENNTYSDTNFTFGVHKPINKNTEIGSTKSFGIQGSPRPEIIGKLYFHFNNESIPVHFVQESDGTINVGLDGISLCDELNNSGRNKSVLLTVLCNCARSPNCASTTIN
ncbi:uncharacterized protein LOC116413282 isoform X2 [Galleria mellonella]|uniref:Uncharacterized protein LOC116413282 isoform X2 n=1 Tax=Galleria mellonella TaxID=7137 RepID=A0ABM3MMS6_GALME|nr:uncharacterized protein LOC116413282 isoform X2 [Galleria mellonella]